MRRADAARKRRRAFPRNGVDKTGTGKAAEEEPEGAGLQHGCRRPYGSRAMREVAMRVGGEGRLWDGLTVKGGNLADVAGRVGQDLDSPGQVEQQEGPAEGLPLAIRHSVVLSRRLAPWSTGPGLKKGTKMASRRHDFRAQATAGHFLQRECKWVASMATRTLSRGP